MPNSFFQGVDSNQNLPDYYRSVLGSFADQLSNPSSQYYQQFRDYLGSVTPTQGINSILSSITAGGGNFGASQVQANALLDAFQKKRNDFLNTTVKGFASQNIGQAQNAISTSLQSALAQIFERDRNNAQQGGALDFLGSILGSIGGGAASGIGAGIGGGSSAAAGAGTAFAALSDVRFKENLKKVGISPSGINVYEFNYKGDDKRYRGVIAQEVPKASIDINGIKYVDYSKIDVKFEVV